MPSVLGKKERLMEEDKLAAEEHAESAAEMTGGPEAGDEDALSRDEILARAKKENQNGDERQRAQMQWANYAGFIAMEFACIIVMFARLFTSDEFTPEFFCIMFTGIAAQNIVQACVTKNPKTKIVFIVCAALITACTVVYWVFWILKLCGIQL